MRVWKKGLGILLAGGVILHSLNSGAASAAQTAQVDTAAVVIPVPQTPPPKPSAAKKPLRKTEYVVKKKENGNWYIVKKETNGTHIKTSRVKGRFVKTKQGTYYVDQKGIVLTGWRKIKKQYYYFDRQTGKQKAGEKVDGIALGRDGTAKETTYNIRKIKTMMKARVLVSQITKESDSKGQKLKKCFRWIFKFPYKRYRILRKVKNQAGWELDFAEDIFIRRQGCCVSEASAFAFLAKECGYKNIYLCDDTGHGWTEIGGRVFDPLFAEARSFAKNYNVPYGVYRLHAIGRTKI
ncbi:MAG: hypothetical protein NC293_13050 [Roseburia sp.]|nr:hypothetical protein [Roseburia sp.]